MDIEENKSGAVALKRRRFTDELEIALIIERVKLPPDILFRFEPVLAYRKVKIKASKSSIDITDFWSQVQMISNNITVPRPVDRDNIDEYGCSFFKTRESLLAAFSKAPKKYIRKICVAKGYVTEEMGALYSKGDEEHIMLFVFSDVDCSKQFSLEGRYTV